ncbi:MAG TPA: hypothetical protein VEC16_02825 [Alphaproteobacteria bacterium]|nr:hypothetical protein [Alphaproteobacteria bacterium]
MSRLKDSEMPGIITHANYVKIIQNQVTRSYMEHIDGQVPYDRDKISQKEIGLLIDYKLNTGDEKSRLYVGLDITLLLNDASVPESNLSGLIAKEITEYYYGKDFNGIWFKKENTETNSK